MDQVIVKEKWRPALAAVRSKRDEGTISDYEVGDWLPSDTEISGRCPSVVKMTLKSVAKPKE